MVVFRTVLCVFIAFTLRIAICGIAFIPERSEITYVNEKYTDSGKLTIRRNNRNGPYVINVEGRLKHYWGNNVTFQAVFFERLSNEYKRTFIEFEKGVCDWFRDSYAKPFLNLYGMKVCPVPAGYYKFSNMTFSLDEFRFVWPFEKTRMNVTIFVSSTGEKIATLYICATIKQTAKKGSVLDKVKN